MGDAKAVVFDIRVRDGFQLFAQVPYRTCAKLSYTSKLRISEGLRDWGADGERDADSKNAIYPRWGRVGSHLVQRRIISLLHFFKVVPL